MENYGTTRAAGKLREAVSRLEELLEKQDTVAPRDVLTLQKAVREDCDAGRFSEATARIEAFRRRPGSGDDAGQVRELENLVRRKTALKPR